MPPSESANESVELLRSGREDSNLRHSAPKIWRPGIQRVPSRALVMVTPLEVSPWNVIPIFDGPITAFEVVRHRVPWRSKLLIGQAVDCFLSK